MIRHPKAIIHIICAALFFGCTISDSNFQLDANLPSAKLLEKEVEITCIEFTKRTITLNEITERSKRHYYTTVISKIPVYQSSIIKEDVWLIKGSKLRYIPFVIDKNFEKRKYENPEDYFYEEVNGYVFLEMFFTYNSDKINFEKYYVATISSKNRSLPGGACDLWLKDYQNETGLNAIEEFGIVYDRMKCLGEVRRVLNLN